jgi:hypothetical protein
VKALAATDIVTLHSPHRAFTGAARLTDMKLRPICIPASYQGSSLKKAGTAFQRSSNRGLDERGRTSAECRQSFA